ncbi:MAG TPA: sialate O-acetylesterase [Terrimicrobiaceae bacterium]|nr:sialate O-acetylesterase [Terrimicrobiaceae bacterium]
MSKISPWAAALLVLPLGSAPAAVKPNSLFTDHMVLQQGQPVPVWGTADPGEKVSVAFGGQAEASATAGADGRWMAVLPPLAMSRTPAELVIRGENEIRISDVLVGEVWIGSGQSNMQMPVAETWDAGRVAAEAAAGRFGLMRIYRVGWTAADERVPDANSRWQAVTAPSAASFSATLFYFGEALLEALPGTPIGLIASSVGGTNAHAWLPRPAYQADPALAPLRKWYEAQVARLPELDPAYDQKLREHEEKLAAVRASGQPIPKDLQRPPEPPMGPRSKRRPTSLYNGMIAPLQPFAFQGVVWYQGENNASLEWAGYYADLMHALITGWRAEWAAAAGAAEARSFPFYVAQLPNYQTPLAWPLLREQQLAIPQKTPDTALAVLLDCGDAQNIHPANKTPAGRRLALLALAHTYRQRVDADSPAVVDVAYAGGKAVVTFSEDGLRSADGQPLRHFEIAGTGGQFHPADAEIRGNQVRLSSSAVPEPAAVRYAWSNNPEAVNFVDASGLPASPFRTDRLPWSAPAASPSPVPQP